MTKRELGILGTVFCALLVLSVFAYRERDAGGALRGVSLAALSGATRDLGECGTGKCLTVYVSPWCGVCRASTGMIREFRDYLNGRGVECRIVVGRDAPEAVAEYAREFGPETLLDAGGRFPLRGGVPNFTVSDAQGAVLKSLAGVPGIHQPPVEPAVLAGFARALGLEG